MKAAELAADVVIIGAGVGGVAAALAALRLGRSVILSEETDWIGGQLTAQGVPPDESIWIEEFGCTASYRRFRDLSRNYYRAYYPLLDGPLRDAQLNPGLGNVSRLCLEPRVALAVLEGMLAPYRAGGRLVVLTRHAPVSVQGDHDRVKAVTLRSLDSGRTVTLSAPFILDATELGDLLELGGVEHVIGAESQAETGEPHALSGAANPLDQQAFSWCFALDHRPGEDHTIDRPEDYDFWSSYQPEFWPNRFFSWDDVHPVTLQPRHREIFGDAIVKQHAGDFWHYRRIFYKGHYPPGMFESDITLVNWPQIDYLLGPLVGVSEDRKREHVSQARQLSLSFLYWMQTEAPRHDGHGYPGLRLRPDVLGTHDGLAKSVYVRESRRIQAEFTVLEQHVGVEARGGLIGAQPFADSVGIGQYRIDLHPSSSGRNYVDVASWPFQIPLGALIPQRIENLLPAGKNIASTHITNGCYRLHPVEWNIGEAAGALAAHCLQERLTPRQVQNTPRLLEDYQRLLTRLGVPLEWPEPYRSTPSPSF